MLTLLHTWSVQQGHVVEYEVAPATALRLVSHRLPAQRFLEEHPVPRDVAHGGGLGDAGVKDEHSGLAQEGPVGRELVLEDESKLVLVGALLLISRGTPAGFCSEM